MDTPNTEDAGAPTPELDELEAPARELTTEESQNIAGGGGLMLERRATAEPDDTSGARGIVMHE